MNNKLISLKKHQLVKLIRIYEKAVKAKCYDCMGGHKKTDCEIKDCSLYKHRPWAKKINSDKVYQKLSG